MNRSQNRTKSAAPSVRDLQAGRVPDVTGDADEIAEFTFCERGSLLAVERQRLTVRPKLAKLKGKCEKRCSTLRLLRSQMLSPN